MNFTETKQQGGSRIRVCSYIPYNMTHFRTSICYN